MKAKGTRTGAASIAALSLLLFCQAALAAPNHPPLPDPIGGFALNHACGTAVDSKGDIYASNAGAAKVEVFDPAGTHLASIPDANQPCGLAVDSKGNLYASDTATGKVVKYVPNTYPFSGTLTYGAPTTVDASGNAKGIAVDPFDDSLYVAEGSQATIYKSDGSLFTDNELQALIFPGSPSAGTYTLEFKGQKTTPIAFNAGNAEIQAALEALSTIGAGNASVEGGGEKIAFKGALAATDVPQIAVDASALVGSSAEVKTRLQGFNGHLEGLSGATGIASYTYRAVDDFQKRRYISLAEPGADRIEALRGGFGTPPLPAGFLPGTLEATTTIDGSGTPAGELGLASTSHLGVDQKNGHIFAYDATHKVVNEFEATGQYFAQIASEAFADAKPTAIAVDRSGTANDGRVYVSAGEGAGAKLLAFGPVEKPSRATLGEPPARKQNNACGTAVDSQGDVYLAGESAIKVYSPAGSEIASIADPGRPCYLVVDPEGNLYAADLGAGTSGDEKVVLYQPSAYPFSGTPTYTEKASPIETINEPRGLAVDPVNGHLFVTHSTKPAVVEYGSAEEGSPLLVSGFCGFSAGSAFGIDVYGTTGEVYVVSSGVVEVCSAGGERVLAIDGSGSPGGAGGIGIASIAVDQSNGHVLVGEMESRGDVEEFDASGAFIAKFGSFAKESFKSDVALDNSAGPAKGNLYVAYRNDLSAFGPLKYGEPPAAATGAANGIGGGEATLHGTVDPRGFETSECKFQYVTKAAFEASGFSDLSSGGSQACAESAGEIGAGSEAVAVHAQVAGLDPEATYCFRLLAANKFGSSAGQASCFGPPQATTEAAQPTLYSEATLHGEVDPSGLETDYFFEYGKTAAYGQSTSPQSLSANAGPTAVNAFLTGLEEGTEYHFRLVAESEAGIAEGPDQVLVTQARPPAQECPNQTLRLENNSTNLPDCRAYELVTPADMNGAAPHAENGGASPMFNNWLVTPSGPEAGDSLAFFIEATLPGTEGNGTRDAFRTVRGEAGWSGSLFSPSLVQAGNNVPIIQQGLSADQLYSFWLFGATEPGAFPPGHYLRTPSGFEAIGQGSLGTDPEAEGKYISPGASHVIFATTPPSVAKPPPVQLEPAAPPAPLGAVYDRSPGGQTHVVSLLPGDVTPSSDATYQGATADGASVVFSVNGALYLRRDNAETLEVAPAPASFAGISEDGKRVFYTDKKKPDEPAGLWAFDVEGETGTQIAADAKFVNVSADGSHAYFTAEEAGQKLFVWDGGASRAVATLAADDLQKGGKFDFPGTGEYDSVALDSWTAECVSSHQDSQLTGPGFCPSRTTPDGRFLVFQSHADLAPPYEGNGHSEIYRYDAKEESLTCVSCDPSGAPASADADLQDFNLGAGTQPSTIIPNVTDGGQEVFFQTKAQLLPEDANSTLDVYEWQAQGTAACKRASGCLSLISSGQSNGASEIYSMTPDGHDVFFRTDEKLIGSDIPGSPSIYDARVGGGFPQPVQPEPCHGDACQGEATPPPAKAPISTAASGAGNLETKPAKKKHRHKKKRHHRRRATR